MKKSLLSIYYSLALLALLFPTLSVAQNVDRVALYTKSGEMLTYRVEHLDSIKFITEEADLSLHPSITPHSDGQTGKMKLIVGQAGANVSKIQMVLPESYMVSRLNDYQCLRLFNTTMAKRYNTELYEVRGGVEYDLSGMQQGYSYTALFLPYDQFDCPGNVIRVDFNVPSGPLKGNPQVNVEFSEITTESYKIKITPNDDVKGYFYLSDLTDNPDRENIMKMFNIPDLKHYVVRFGGTFPSQQPHEGVATQTISGLKPNTNYTMYIVLIDADGQYSDLIDVHNVTTVKRGTSEVANVSIEIGKVTETSATITTRPDKNTSLFRETVVQKGDMTDQQIIDYLTKTPESQELPWHTSTYAWTWDNLEKGTTYMAVGIAKNADEKFGPLVKKEFTTKK